MNNPINWGGTPLENAAIRGFIAAILAGVLSISGKLLTGAEIEEAALTGVTVAVPLLIGLLGFGAADQARANRGTVIASDVPVQVAAKNEALDPVVVAGDWGMTRGRK